MLNPYNARKALIVVAKSIPFILCAFILVAYIETLFACILSHFNIYGGVVIPNTPLSFIIGRLFEYDYLLILMTCLISIAIEVCKWNLIAIFYMFLNLLEKSCFDFEISVEMICIIAIANILTSGYIVFKGVKIAFTKNKRNGIKTIN